MRKNESIKYIIVRNPYLLLVNHIFLLLIISISLTIKIFFAEFELIVYLLSFQISLAERKSS